MLMFWIILAAAIYFTLLGCVLVFFTAVGKINDRWERALEEFPESYDEQWRRAA